MILTTVLPRLLIEQDRYHDHIAKNRHYLKAHKTRQIIFREKIRIHLHRKGVPKPLKNSRFLSPPCGPPRTANGLALQEQMKISERIAKENFACGMKRNEHLVYLYHLSTWLQVTTKKLKSRARFFTSLLFVQNDMLWFLLTDRKVRWPCASTHV